MLKDLLFRSSFYRRIYKNYLRVSKPLANAFYNRQVAAIRQQGTATEDLDALVPDQRVHYSEQTDQIRHIALRILMCFDHLSHTHHFQYFLAYGSLLGAVRHQGFIPWDDDLDIMMLPEDFARFKKVCYELPTSLRFVRQNKGLWKVMDRYSIISKDGQRGVALDIFVAESIKDQYFFINVHNQQPILFSTEHLRPLQQLPFEQEFRLPAPAQPAYFLTSLYGDFMQLPPASERIFPHLGSSIQIGTFGGRPLN